ncbi:MAG: GNAT family N-acetyltransferase [Gemmatimonadaceae bacterium]|nr:GNAT family N-acetyltransferase [Acetobacteraceae bacterium]
MQITAAPLSAIGAEWDPLFGPGVQSTRLWFGATTEAALPPGTRAEFLLCRDAGRPAAILPLLLGPDGRARGLSTVYTCLYHPLLAPGLPAAAIRHAGAAFARYVRRWSLLVLDAMDPEWPPLAPLLTGFGDGGLVARRFAHFGNWYEPVAGLAWPDYLAARPGQLRETIRRKVRACDRDGRVRFDVVRSPAGLDAAAAAYDDIYRRSWKVPEPAPGFTPALLQRAAAAGILRMGIMWVGADAVAAQYWLVADGTATVLKLAHDDAWRSLSPGTVLTQHIVRLLLEEGVAALDFGRGDDGYKSLWTTHRRPRIGVLLANPYRPSGLVALLRHDAGLILRRRSRTIHHRSVSFPDAFTPL